MYKSIFFENQKLAKQSVLERGNFLFFKIQKVSSPSLLNIFGSCKSFFKDQLQQESFTPFLVACTRLYKTLCWSIGRSIGPSVSYIYFLSQILLFWGLQRLITAPAQPHATKIAVYTALFIFRLGLLFPASSKWLA